MRNVREFVPVGSGFIGLRKFYPGAASKAGKLGKTAAPRKGARAKALKPKAAAARVAKAPKADPGVVKEAVRKIMSDHAPRTSEQIHKTVNSELAKEVKKVAIVGALRSKDYVQIDDKYQLRQVNEGPQVIQ